MSHRLDGKVILVTGAAGGIGSSICELFLNEGARVIGTDMNNEPRLDSPLRSSSSGLYRAVDITDETGVAKLVDEAAAKWGPFDVLVNAAGVLGAPKPSYEATSDEFDFVYGVNVKGTWIMCKYVVPNMIENGGGSIINFSSIAGLVGGTSGLALYHGTKGAVRLMTKADAADLAQYGIRVNSIHPGSIETPMSARAARESPAGANEHSKEIVSKHLLQRRGHPSEIAYGALFLASDESSFSTGTELIIDGGYTAH